MNIRQIIIFLFLAYSATSQESFELNEWQHLDPSESNVYGVSTNKLYQNLDAKSKQTVVVAVIDSGVDIEHEDLKKKIWINLDEIPGNGIDDDKNGYIDDFNGWNFIGGPNGEPVIHDTYEITRLIKEQEELFKSLDTSQLKGKAKEVYENYRKEKEKIERQKKSAQKNYEETVQYEYVINTALTSLKDALGEKSLTKDNVRKIDDQDNMSLRIAKQIIDQVLIEESEQITIDELIESFASDIKEQKEYFQAKYKYNYNLDFNPRKIVGDNYSDVNERYYGNPYVNAPFSEHGTHVAGIIGAERSNNIGLDGIAEDVRIMPIRAVPDGDERDKDVANAIYYAVDNGASIINMSFGKGDSPYKDAVDRAVKYAEKHDVLLIHAAGNSSMDNDEEKNFPNDKFKKRGLFRKKTAKNWLAIGALSWQNDENLVASFSNYGDEQVDVFAPGVDIYSTLPENTYKPQNGTSMAAPVVSGVAAVLRSYFPELSAKQVKEIIMESSNKLDRQVIIPGTEETTSFGKLCASGGTVNAAKAFELASKTKGKNKNKSYKHYSYNVTKESEVKARKPRT